MTSLRRRKQHERRDHPVSVPWSAEAIARHCHDVRYPPRRRGDLSEAELTTLGVPLDPQLRDSLRKLAAEEGRSQRQMARHVIAAGLRALGADHAEAAEAVQA
jgi:hypothetical protein